MKSESQNSYVEIKQRTDRDIRQMGILVSESFEAESTDQQTVINLNMSVDINNKKQVWVFVDGVKLIEGGNYNFTNVVNSVSAQITLTSPIIAGLPIQVYKLGAYQESFPNPSSVTATLLNDVMQPHKMAQAAFQPFVQKTFVTASTTPTSITAPYTSIVNRAPIEAGSLKAIMGIERVLCRSIVLSRTEFGPAGESVYEADTKDSRIRFVGADWASLNNTNGARIQTNTAGCYVEISFYGTGLNLVLESANTLSTATYVLDGGSAVTLGNPASQTNVLGTRNYNTNQIINVPTGTLTLGWHTVKVISAGASLDVYGFEVINQRTDLAVLAGVAFNGMKQETIASLDTTAFNAGVVGTRGARIVKYALNNDISQAVTEVNAAAAYLTSTDHTNEEVVKKINYIDFGTNRADDFSTAISTGNSRAFTLDDGTTTLVGNTLYYSNSWVGNTPAITANGTGFGMTITFVGTGLDAMIYTDSGTRTFDIYIDGSLVGTSSKSANTTPEIRKFCSGLAYGTHTVKFLATSGTAFAVSDFLIYQPKKPTLPVGAIEVCDYCLMANYVANTTTGLETIATGVLRKSNTREIIYTGTVTFGSIDPSVYIGGWYIASTATGSTVEYTFFGSGFDLRFQRNVSTGSGTIYVDGVVFNTTNFPTQAAAATTYPTGQFTSSTGVLSNVGSLTRNCGFAVSGLTLGIHKIKMVAVDANSLSFLALDIITPIHINHPTLKIGSLSLRDSRCFSPIVDKPEIIDLSKAKALCIFDSVNTKILGGFGISQVLNAATGKWSLYFEKPFKNSNYVAIGTVNNTSRYLSTGYGVEKTPSFINIYTQTDANSSVSDSIWNVVFFGELENEGEI